MRTSFHHQSEAQPPNGQLTAATSPDTPSLGSTRIPAVAEISCITNLSQRLLVGINDAAGLLLGGREHGLIAHAAPGLEVRGFGDAVILDLQHSGFGPFAVFAEPDAGRHDGVELVGPQI